ncbi:MAG: hypothetical protein GVY18_11605, partial [Bacteroidetes bacterium]|nr:hypothetical protein [Bacteroidota bacterium]
MATVKQQTADAPPQSQEDAHAADHNYLNHETTIWSWLSTKDHKRIGIL